MSLYARVRALPALSLCFAAMLLPAPLSFGKVLFFGKKPAERQQAQAQVLDHAELLCDNCFFGESHYFYCFAVDNKIMIAQQATRVINFQDDSKNYAEKADYPWNYSKTKKGDHPWLVWAPPGKDFPISYDDQHVWVKRPDGKEVKLTQDKSGDVFSSNARCMAVGKDQAH